MIHTHTRSAKGEVFDMWGSQDRFTKNPDMVQLASGRMLLIYSDTDAHWSEKNQALTLLASDDGGQTWFKHREVDTADLTAGDERLVTPRLSLAKDGRLALIVDHNDNAHFHEDQEPGNWIYWSEDEGDTWSGPQVPAVLGFEPEQLLGGLGGWRCLSGGLYELWGCSGYVTSGGSEAGEGGFGMRGNRGCRMTDGVEVSFGTTDRTDRTDDR